MTLFNYTALKTRESRIYEIAGYRITGGAPTKFIILFLIVNLVFLFLGFLTSLPFKINMFRILDSSWNRLYFFTWLGLGLSTSFALWFIKFSTYRLYEYLLAYMKPKKTFVNNIDHSTTPFKKTYLKHLQNQKIISLIDSQP